MAVLLGARSAKVFRWRELAITTAFVALAGYGGAHNHAVAAPAAPRLEKTVAGGGQPPSSAPMKRAESAERAIAAPRRLAASAGAGQVALRWRPVQGATSYSIRRAVVGDRYLPLDAISFTAIGTSTRSDYIDQTAQQGTNYIYTVVANGSRSTSLPSNFSCSAAAASDSKAPGVRPRVFMAMHGSNELADGDATMDAAWAYVRTCLDGMYGNTANIDIDTQANLWRKINTRALFGIVNANDLADDPDPVFPTLYHPPFWGVESRYPDIQLNRLGVVVYSLYPSLWENATIDELKLSYTAWPNPDPTVSPQQVFEAVYVGNALRGWLDPSVPPLGALSNPGAAQANADADGVMVECIGGLCGSGGDFGDGFLQSLRTARANNQRYLMFVSESAANGLRTGWLQNLQSEFQKAADEGLWRDDDIVMIINYQGDYPRLPMLDANGDPADTVTGMLYWALHQ